ncbi:DUF6950 family protein [Mesorhizobium muleiense]|uniref:DUF6950 family protein n=1 Tax=Mesorhizobium muleiense TaxID=1004279 RepID=UPI001F34CC32|nr:hypothetical protein [Mesorhizobium muleiense]MCF6112007.1 hypothetical protein [Mesorhizobium muleiense]
MQKTSSETDLLARYLAEERLKGFAWGCDNGDCLLFLLGWAERAVGRRASVAWRASYCDEAGARAALSAFGGAPAAVCDVLGPPRIGSKAQRGDVGLLAFEDWHLGMICTGNLWAIRDVRRGVRLLRKEADIVWSTGFVA